MPADKPIEFCIGRRLTGRAAVSTERRTVSADKPIEFCTGRRLTGRALVSAGRRAVPAGKTRGNADRGRYRAETDRTRRAMPADMSIEGGAGR